MLFTAKILLLFLESFKTDFSGKVKSISNGYDFA